MLFLPADFSLTFPHLHAILKDIYDAIYGGLASYV